MTLVSVAPPVAIVAWAGITPGAATIEDFWAALRAGCDAATPPPPGRWCIAPERAHAPGLAVTPPDRVRSTQACFVTSTVDPPEDVHAGEAWWTREDPLVTWMIDAARRAWQPVAAPNLDPRRVGVVLGHILLPTTSTLTLAQRWGATLGTNPAPAAAAHRLARWNSGRVAGAVAQALGLGGPHRIVDAACSSTFYALAQGVHALQRGTVDAMLVGGGQRADSFYTQVGFSQLQALSLRGACRPFDHRADGLVVGEGAAVFVLRRLADARRDDQPILAVIRGIGLSNDRRGGLLVPQVEGQVRAIEAAYREAGCSPASIDLLECHATGTPRGDATELTSLHDVWTRSDARPGACALGAVKANVGHWLTGAGAAALAKVLLCLHHREIPPLANFERWAPSLQESSRPFRAPTTPEAWSGRGPLRAALSGFGFGGTNAHVVLEGGPGDEASRVSVAVPERAQASASDDDPVVVVGWSGQVGALVDADLGVAWRGEAALRASAEITRLEVPTAAFKVPPRELECARPQQLLPLLLARRALAGLTLPEPVTRGVFVGTGLDPALGDQHLRWLRIAEATGETDTSTFDTICPPLDADRTLGGLASLVASRIARAHDCGGPSLTTSSEETSGLTALGLAAAALQRGELEAAIVAAVEFAADPRIAAFEGGLREPEAAPAADGGVVLVLMRRSRALATGNPVLATVLTIAEGTGGVLHERCPPWPVQVDVIRRALADADRCASRVQAGVFAGADTVRSQAHAERAWRRVFGPTPWKDSASVLGDAGHARSLVALVAALEDAPSAAPHLVAIHAVSSSGAMALGLLEIGPKAEPSRPAASGRDTNTQAPRDETPARRAEPSTAAAGHVDADGTVLRIPTRHIPHVRPATAPQHPVASGVPHHPVASGVPHHPVASDVPQHPVTSGVPQHPVASGVPQHPVASGVPQHPVASAVPSSATSPPGPLGPLDVALPAPFAPFAPFAPARPSPAAGTSPPPAYALTSLGAPQDARNLAPRGPLLPGVIAHLHATQGAHAAYLALARQRLALLGNLLVQPPAPGLARPTPVRPTPVRDDDAELAVDGTVRAGQRPKHGPQDVPAVWLDRDACQEFAVGRIGVVLGADYAAIDAFPTRVRLPDAPLMLVDRILAVDGVPRSLGRGRLVTEHDIEPGAWYLDGGHIPTCIAVEAGQADLFLSAYLGIDEQTRGLAMYRLLDATIEFHAGLPGPGETIRYDIHIERFFRQGETWLFRFAFEATVDGRPLLSMRDGCAGFFTPARLAAGQGVVPSPIPPSTRPARLDPGTVWREPETRALGPEALAALRRGDLAHTFGPAYAALPVERPLTLPGGDMALLDRVTHLDPTGGPWQGGRICGEYDVRPDAWFLRCHFVDDPVMPGTLMYECCLHTLRVLLLGWGWIGETDEVVFEPIPGIRSRLECRGQVLPTTRVVGYDVAIRERAFDADGTPYVIADATMSADGRTIVRMSDMSVRLRGTTRARLDRFHAHAPAANTESAHARPAHAPAANVESAHSDAGSVAFARERILAFAQGRPSDAFGPEYAVFDEERRIARLPRPPFLLVDRILEVQGAPFVMKAGARASAELDLAAHGWLFDAARQDALPFAVLLEIALQPCGWLAAYVGSPLQAPHDLRFRNLGGEAQLQGAVDRHDACVSTTVSLERVSHSGGMILQHFRFACSTARSGCIYAGTTYFGYFSDSALAAQVGLRDALPLDPPSGPPPVRRMPLDPPFPDARWRMIDHVEQLSFDDGRHGLGRIRGSIEVDPSFWFFAAHFYQDPVWPGSLGLQAALQLLQVWLHTRFELGPATTWATTTQGPHQWVYRGQVLPSAGRVVVDATIVEVDPDRCRVVADATLWVDGRPIYEMRNFGMEARA